MGYFRPVRAIAGLLSVVALLVLVLGEFFTGQSADPSRIWLLLVMISGLLGVDLVSEYLPLSVTVDTTHETDDRDHEND